MSIANTGGVATPTQANRAKKSNSADSRGARVKLESRMTHLSGFAHDQLLLLPEAVDDYVDGDNPICFIDAFVEGLDLAAVGFITTSRSKRHRVMTAICAIETFERRPETTLSAHCGPHGRWSQSTKAVTTLQFGAAH
jgi:hypothetical protein